MTKLHKGHRCFGDSPHIIVAHMPKGFGKFKVWGVWTTDGVDIIEACLVIDSDTYYQAIRPAIMLAFEIQTMNQFKDWPIGLYYGADGFANHDRYEINDESDAVMHILANT